MSQDAQLIFADHVGRFYARHYGFPPIAGRVLGYLLDCDPPQTIDELSDTLLASRNAITGGDQVAGELRAGTTHQVVRRTDGPRDPEPDRPTAAELRRHPPPGARGTVPEGLNMLTDASPSRRAPLEEMVALAEFLAERLAAPRDEWHAHREELHASGKLPSAHS